MGICSSVFPRSKIAAPQGLLLWMDLSLLRHVFQFANVVCVDVLCNLSVLPPGWIHNKFFKVQKDALCPHVLFQFFCTSALGHLENLRMGFSVEKKTRIPDTLLRFTTYLSGVDVTPM